MTDYFNGIFNPTFNYNTVNRATHRNRRIYNEILMIAPQFAYDGGVDYDEYNFDWIKIPDYPLPEKWQESSCGLLILIPSTYPDTPPIGFYLDQQLRLMSGATDPHIISGAAHGAPNLMDSGWYWYCVTIPGGYGGWRPSGNYRNPDNLATFLDLVRETLTSDY